MTTHHSIVKLPPPGRCFQCGGILRSEKWRCWICMLFEALYGSDRRN